ncbi:MAG: hypothetical protein ACXWV1_14335 [Chitinophagaceae bacterium]
MILLVMSVLISFTTPDKLTGRLETRPSEKGNITGVVFKAVIDFYNEPDKIVPNLINRDSIRVDIRSKVYSRGVLMTKDKLNLSICPFC